MKKIIKIISISLVCILAFIGFISIILFYSRDNSAPDTGIPVVNIEANQTQKDTSSKKNTQVLSYGDPSLIYGTSFKFMEILMKVDNSDNESYKRANYYDEHIVNLLFYDYKKQIFNMLFDKKALVLEVSYPNTKEDSLKNIILYKAITSDTDNNGKLTRNDNSMLYISDLTGKQLRQVTTSKTNYLDYHYLGNNQLLISVTVRKKNNETAYWVKDYYVYDITSSTLNNKNKFSENLKKARNILGMQ